MTKSKDPKLQAVLRRAHLAGVRAADEAVPTPMVVYESEGLSDRPKEDGKSWYVPEGPCGFGWVWFDVDGRSRNAKELKAYGARKHYYGGLSLWSPIRTQSVTRNRAWADAFAEVVRNETDIVAYGQSRLD